jgi:hypothetical protein
MRRWLSGLSAILVSASFVTMAASLQGPAVTVTGDRNPNRWSTPNDSSQKKNGTIGDVTGRMQAPVADGDVVAFVVNSGTHHVIFENAKSEQASGVWEVVAGSGTLDELPPKTFPHYNHDEARYSDSGTGNLIQIRIKNLPQGKSILFGCNPHSESKNNNKDVPMLGAIVGK